MENGRQILLPPHPQPHGHGHRDVATYRIGRDDTGGNGEESGGKDMKFHDEFVVQNIC